jgi:phage terminase Nu1 subunit (DNA packaging protein)
MKKKSAKPTVKTKKKQVVLDIRGKSRLGEIYGVGRNSIDRWIIKGCPAKKVNGIWYFNSAAVDKWNQTREEGLEKADPELTRQRARLVRLQADRKEIELLRTKSELLPVREALAVWSAVIITMKTRLQAFPRKMAPIVCGCTRGTEIEELLRREIDQICNELAEPDLRALAKKSAAKGGK